MDTRTGEQRSMIMRAVRSKNTTPEIAVRQLLHRLGFRFRVHRRNLPGTPDIAFPSRRLAIFVNGCYWHGHNCSKGKLPKSNSEFWTEKIDRNKQRDVRVATDLAALGWRSEVIWQCELRDMDSVKDRLVGMLKKPID